MNIMKKILLSTSVILMVSTVLVAEENNDSQKTAAETSKNNKFDGWSIRFYEYMHADLVSYANAESGSGCLSLCGAVRYGAAIKNSPFWIGGEISPLNWTWKFNASNVRNYDFMYYMPTVSIVLGWIKDSVLSHFNFGFGYAIPFGHNKSIYPIDKGGFGFSFKIGSDYLVTDTMIIGGALEIRYINIDSSFNTHNKTKMYTLESSLGLSVGYQF
jgi:hypothetical protein